MIEKTTIEMLIRAGQAAPSADNSQPLRFTWDENQLSVHYDADRVRDKTFPAENPATLLAAGAAIYNICETARELGLSTEIERLSADAVPPNPYASIRVLQNTPHTEPRDPSPAKAIFDRHTNRFPFTGEKIPHQVLTQLEKMQQDEARLLTITEPSRIKRVGQLVKKASEIRFQTREVHEWLASSLRFPRKGVKKADGLDLKTLALPPGGGLLLKLISDWGRMSTLNRLGFHKLLSAIDARPVEHAPALIAIIAPDTTQGILSAGQLLERCWIYLNSQKIAVHPYYVISDQLVRLKSNSVPPHLAGLAETIKASARQELGYSSNEHLCMLLRIGRPKNPSPERSLRLELEEVFSCPEPLSRNAN